MKNIKIHNFEITVKNLLIYMLFCGISLFLCIKYVNAYKKVKTEDEINKQEEKKLDNKLRMRGLSIYLGDDEVYRFIRVYGGNLFFKNDIDSKFYSMSSFLLGEIPVTNRLFQYVMNGTDIGATQKDGMEHLEKYYPVAADLISNEEWFDFINKLGEKTGHKFRLPTVEEWEYAARGGRESRGFKYAGSDKIDEVAVYKDDNHDVRLSLRCKQKKANELGLYDMSGLVDEITLTRWSDFRPDRLVFSKDSIMKENLKLLIVRGGDANSTAEDCLIKSDKEKTSNSCGARLLLDN